MKLLIIDTHGGPLYVSESTIQVIQDTMEEGAKKHPENNYPNYTIKYCLHHALTHIYLYLGGAEREQGDQHGLHLPHALCNLMFAAANKENNNGESQQSTTE